MSIKKHLSLIFPLLIIPLLLVIIWFRNGLIVGGGDESFIFYDPQTSLGVLNTTWQEYQTGIPFLAWLSRSNFVLVLSVLQKNFFIPPFFLQAATFYILMVTGIVSVYFLGRSFLINHKKSHLISLVSALFYLFNPFSLSQVWGRGLYAQYFSFVLLPLSLLLFAIGLKRRKFIFVIILSFSSFFFSTAFGFVTFVVVLWGVLLLYLIYWFLKNNQKEDLLFGTAFFFLSFVVWCLISAWWLLPLIISGNSILAGYLGDSSENLGTLLGVSKNFTPDIVIRLLQRTYYFDTNAFSPIYKSFLFQLISFIPLVFVVIGSIKVLRSSNMVNFRFLFILLALGLVVSLGANPPSGWFFMWVFERVSFLQSFRNPFEKFGLVYTLGYSAVFALGLVSCLGDKKIRNIAIFIFLVTTCGIFAWPMWSGKVVSSSNNTPGVDVPKYYRQLNDWLSVNNKEGYRIFMTPIWSGDGALYQWNNTRYNGIDPMMFLLNTTAISSSPSIPYFYDFIQNIRKYMERIDIAPALGLLRAYYLVNRNDAVVENKDKQQKVFLAEAIFPPGSIREGRDNICQNLYSNSRTQGLAWIICRVSLEKGDWSQVRYLHITVKTEVAAYLELAVTDQNLTRIRWDGRFPTGGEYKTLENEWSIITIPLNAPTEYNAKMNFSKVIGVEILAYPLSDPKASVNEISLQQIYLDPGLEEKTNMFSIVNTFGDLQVYKPNRFKAPEEFGTLKEVNSVKGFVDLFKGLNKEVGLISQKGFVLESQNPQEKLINLLFESDIKARDKYKLSNTRYWLEVEKGKKEGLLILSKTYNPEWKVISGVTRKMLAGGLLNDLNLLKMQVVPEKDHFVVNGYANLWRIDSVDTQYAIVFMPQIIADIGSNISVFSIILLAVLTILWQLIKYISSR